MGIPYPTFPNQLFRPTVVLASFIYIFSSKCEERKVKFSSSQNAN